MKRTHLTLALIASMVSFSPNSCAFAKQKVTLQAWTQEVSGNTRNLE